ncbi:XRE family transcriptional regulator [Hymenobacter aquaticus]|uniref:XRE family transcriptional regulator n=1 Tax=Hymenobacter aquaticus TaxID=1867101 RepID=A0A4Z0Q670_9BACT|nr:helix-turn-helix transcriptional regulator [Hymenobacter aquaticus]TGE24561.1 XRE family transcriptional regulator [Hymenobacter aquaticus]
MASRRRVLPTTPIGAVRHYFNLKQEELALILDVGKAIIGHIESGRRGLSMSLQQRLLPLLRHVPQPFGPYAEDEPLPAAAAAPDPEPLRQRHRICLLQAGQLRYQMRPLTARAVYASRWQAAIAAILAELPASTSFGEEDDQTPLRNWLRGRGRQFGPGRAAKWHLLRVRAEALEAEAAALALLLPPPPAPAGSAPEPGKSPDQSSRSPAATA